MLDYVLEQLKLAEKDPNLFFGEAPNEKLKYWHKMCHPDKHKNKDLAESYFTRFTTAFETLSVKPITIKLKDKTYTLRGKPIVGDTSDVYVSDVVVKVGRLNDLSVKFSRNETETLSKFTDKHFSLYVPKVIDSYKQVTVFSLTEDFTRLSDLSNIDGVHIAWITKRLLEILGYAQKLGITHGGITPDNILIFKKSHGAMLLDWKFANQKEVKKSKKFLDLYPVDRIITSETDIFMLVKSLQKVSGNLPVVIQNFFKGCLQEKQSMRPNNAWNLLDEFNDVLRRTYGKPKFVEMA